MKIFSWPCFTSSICVCKIICRIWCINTYRFVLFLKFCIILNKYTNNITPIFNNIVVIYLFFGYATQLVGSQCPDQGWNPGPRHQNLGVLTTGLLENSPDTLHSKIRNKENDTQKEESKRESAEERKLQNVLVDWARSFFLTTMINSQWKACLLVNLCFKNENILLKQVGRMIKEWDPRGVSLPQNGSYP